MTMKQ